MLRFSCCSTRRGISGYLVRRRRQLYAAALDAFSIDGVCAKGRWTACPQALLDLHLQQARCGLALRSQGIVCTCRTFGRHRMGVFTRRFDSLLRGYPEALLWSTMRKCRTRRIQIQRCATFRLGCGTRRRLHNILHAADSSICIFLQPHSFAGFRVVGHLDSMAIMLIART